MIVVMTTTPIRAALYARVSTRDQSPDMQLEALRAQAAQRRWTVVAEYVDVGVSGAKARRPELDRLMADARAAQLDLVAVWKFDRFARSTRHLLSALDEFQERRVAFVSLSESIDTTSALGRAVFTIVAAVAELERDLLRERVVEGVRLARSKGKVIGRPQRWTVAQADQARALRAVGRSWREVAMAVGLPVRTVRRAVTTVAKPLTP